MNLRAPFPWFGGKSRVADLVWERLAGVSRYIEPFAGSLAVLLANEDPNIVETVNDLDGYLVNFWRAVQQDPDGVAGFANWPVTEIDLLARHKWLIAQKTDLLEKMKQNPDHFDPKIAGWWLWGICCWIGDGWCKTSSNQLPHLGDSGRGINRKLPHLGNPGRGEYIREMMQSLSSRLRDVRICCGDWRRVCTPAVTKGPSGICGVFLDPPYDRADRDDCYNEDHPDLWGEVCHWCEENGNISNMRIALCGHDGTWTPPNGWESVAWSANGGYGNQGDSKSRGKKNKKRETIWFSPGCNRTRTMFDFWVVAQSNSNHV